MRQILVDHARRYGAAKRGGDRHRVTLGEHSRDGEAAELEVLDLEAKLEELAGLDRGWARVVELRLYGGLTFAEAADVLGVSAKKVEADWYLARAWLRDQLS